MQRLEKIDGLEGCPKLKKLWLIENRISEIENIQPCAALQELYLTTNRITAIGGLDGLVDLQVTGTCCQVCTSCCHHPTRVPW
jgi:protein phosphatase 1 regulatory subunit 7